MKTTTKYVPYISYKAKTWYEIDREFDDKETAVRCAEHIADGHVVGTRVALVQITTQEITLFVLKGKKQHALPQPQYIVCKQCEKRRLRKNIQATGICIKCTLKNSIVHEQMQLQEYKGGDV
jgi:hypothetical protein